LAEQPAIAWKAGVSVCVVVAAQGYPDEYQTGLPISGIDAAESEGAIVFHAGTQLKKTGLTSSGGRILGVTAVGDQFNTAIDQAYAAIQSIQLEGMYYRRDIGHQVNPVNSASS
jgi:phosphoribosylamine--glycine ligase